LPYDGRNVTEVAVLRSSSQELIRTVRSTSAVGTVLLAVFLTLPLPSTAEEGAATSLAGRRGDTSAAAELYRRASPAIVGVTCAVRRGSDLLTYFGTGTVIDANGLVLTSYTVVPQQARDIKVYLRGGRVVSARVVEMVKEQEVTLLRVEGWAKVATRVYGTVPFLHLGSSRAVQVGDPAFTLGNAFNSIQHDDQVAMAAGVISGKITLTKAHHQEATYLGPTLETSAALNGGMDGGPLLDRQGRIVGLLSLNFSKSRWLGTAIPIDVLRPVLARHHGWFDDRDLARGAYLGLEASETDGAVRVHSVQEGAPAAAAGLQRGDVIERVADAAVRSIPELRRSLEAVKPGEDVRFTVRRGDEKVEVEIALWGRF